MDKGIPNCPDCGGKGMCEFHNIEYHRYEYEKARDAYESVMKEYIEKLKERIAQNELSSSSTS